VPRHFRPGKRIEVKGPYRLQGRRRNEVVECGDLKEVGGARDLKEPGTYAGTKFFSGTEVLRKKDTCCTAPMKKRERKA